MRKRLLGTGIGLVYVLLTALAAYELVAKSPRLLGAPLPGWDRADRAEHLVCWRRPTGLLVVDKVLHEGREAFLYYGMMLDRSPARAAAASTGS